MSITPEERAENDLRVANDIQKYGSHVISVFDPEGVHPGFSYSIGLQEAGVPEILIIGLSAKFGHALVNYYNRQVREGREFVRGTRYDGFLEGFPVLLEPTRLGRHADYTRGCTRRYGKHGYRVLQLIYPTTRGAWPWQKAASDAFRQSQPMLGRKRPDRP